MTKPQTAKDLVELYDECLGYVISQAGYDPVSPVDLVTLVNYLRNKQTGVVEEECPFPACDFCQLRAMPSIIVAPTPPLPPLTDKELYDKILNILEGYETWCDCNDISCYQNSNYIIAASSLLNLIKENSK